MSKKKKEADTTLDLLAGSEPPAGEWSGPIEPVSDFATWKPENKGDCMEGYVTRVQDVDTRFGTGTLVRFNTAVGEVTVWMSTILMRYLHLMVPGNYLRVTFEGTVRTAAGFDCKDFTVRVKGEYKINEAYKEYAKGLLSKPKDNSKQEVKALEADVPY